MATTPKISVVMPAYNARETIAEAVDSILSQTFGDFELLIFDDASTDDTPEILARYAASDGRIRVFRSEQNKNYTHRLNEGLALAAAPIVARMDADDVSMPYRFEKQYAFLAAHPETTLCAGQMEYYETGEVTKLPLDDSGIRLALLRDSCMPHPAWMFRKEVLPAAGGYDPSYTPADDYAMLAALAATPGVRFANLPETLIRYRLHLDKDRTKYREVQKRNAARVRATLIRPLVPDASENDLVCHEFLCGFEASMAVRQLAECREWLKRLLAANASAELYNRKAFRDSWLKRWWEVCNESFHIGILRNILTGNELEALPRFELLFPMVLTFAHWLQRKLLPSRWRSKYLYRLERL